MSHSSRDIALILCAFASWRESEPAEPHPAIRHTEVPRTGPAPHHSLAGRGVPQHGDFGSEEFLPSRGNVRLGALPTRLGDTKAPENPGRSRVHQSASVMATKTRAFDPKGIEFILSSSFFSRIFALFSAAYDITRPSFATHPPHSSQMTDNRLARQSSNLGVSPPAQAGMPPRSWRRAVGRENRFSCSKKGSSLAG